MGIKRAFYCAGDRRECRTPLQRWGRYRRLVSGFRRRIEAVVGRPDEKWGEVPVAVIVPALRTELSRADVLALFDGKLARFKHPHDVIFTDALPRNVMGKVLKFELRDMVSP